MKKEVKNKLKKQVNTSEKRTPKMPSQNELGAYGLEPPKLYRKDQQRLVETPKANKSKKSPSKKNTPPKTIQQQRQEENKRRKQKKIIRKGILYSALVVGIVGVIIVLSLTVFFKTQTITIKGNSIYSTKEISAVLPLEKDKNLFLSNTKFAKEKLETTLPYIYNAHIKRKLPSTIVVNIEETPQVYAIKNKDTTYTLLDDNFKVLETNAVKVKKGAILIKKAALSSATAGKEAEFTNKKVKGYIRQLIDAKNSMQLDKITELYSVDINNNYMVYDGRITIKLGEIDNLEDKINSALAAIAQLDEQNPQAEGELTVGTGKQIYFTEK